MSLERLERRDTVAVTNLAAYRRNLHRIADFIDPSATLMGVVKAEAYGHGLVECARAAVDSGVSMLGVAFSLEGVMLRRAGITAPILVMSAESPGHLAPMIDLDLTVTLNSFDMLAHIREEAAHRDIPCRVHVKVDTGMGRVGLPPDDAAALIEEAWNTAGISVDGVFTHFPSADEPDYDDFSRRQIDDFRRLLDTLTAHGVRPPVAHMANSAGVLKFPEAHLDMVRPGMLSYGLLPYPGAFECVAAEPVLSWTSRIGFIKDVPAETPISYGCSYVTERPTRIATVPVGYGDGFRRHLSNKGRALVNGVSAPVVGRVCMDQAMFDITDAGDVAVGDTVTLIGNDGGRAITVEEHAEIVETISYEIVTGITGRVRRAYIDDA